MRVINKVRFMPIIFIVLLVVMMVVPTTPSMGITAQSTVNLGTAKSFAVLAGSQISNTGTTKISGTAGGDVGLHPGDDPTIDTFPGQEDVTLTGTVHLFDAVAEEAKVDLLAAYNDAAGRVSDETISANLGGRTLTPGVYTSESSLGITGTLTLDAGGDANAVFIFQAGSTLTTATGSEVKLINDAQPCRIFWQIGSSATLGTDSYFVGHILAMTSITATTDAEVKGQLLAINGAVTLDTNTIINDVCLAPGSLRVIKDVQGPVGDMPFPGFFITVMGPEGFSDTRTIEAGASYTWEGLRTGTYAVSEGALNDDWAAAGTGEYDVQAGVTTEVTITNTYSPQVLLPNGSLTVAKVVTGDTANITLPEFEITVTGPEGFSVIRPFTHGESFTWEDLVPGEYTVTESRAGLSSEWTVSGEGTVQVTDDQPATATITNNYQEENGSDIDHEGDLPQTSGNIPLIAYSGLILFGLGVVIRRKGK